MQSSPTNTALAPARRRGSYAKTAETRRRILTAAREVAEEEGFHGVSLAAVAQRAGVAVGNVSYHFGSREELLQAVMQDVADQVHEHVMLAAVEGRDVFERGEAAMRAYLAFIHRHRGYVRMAEQVRHHHPEIYRRNLMAWVDLHRATIRTGIAEGSLRSMTEDEIETTAYVIVGAHYFLDQMIEEAGGARYPGDEVVVATYMKLFRSGLEGRRATRQESEV